MITAESEEQMTDVIQQIEGGEKVKDKKNPSGFTPSYHRT